MMRTGMTHADSALQPRADTRFLQANERTLLAWIRTGLALMAFGFVVGRISPWLQGAKLPAGGYWLVYSGAAFLVLGALTSVVGAVRYLRVRTAILAHRPIVPGVVATLALAFAVAILGGVLAGHVLLH
ncbi:MAG: DUF202 domain-containing protein [Myxococcales bacterium]|nr:DUF202 domain-containing protein [Myxococcales bacterium]MDD9966357.1 DUF202 domain-containing protein [Myxococcales bacterium]